MNIATKAFWAATAERAVKTFAQTFAALLGAGAVNLVNVAWTTDASVAGGAALLSVLTSVGSDAVTSSAGPSLTNAEVLPAPVVPAPPEPAPVLPAPPAPVVPPAP